MPQPPRCTESHLLEGLFHTSISQPPRVNIIKRFCGQINLGNPGFKSSQTGFFMVELLDSAEGAETAFLSDFLEHRASLDSLLPATLLKPHTGTVSLELGRVHHHLPKGL